MAFRSNPRGIRQLFGPGGEVGRDIQRRTRKVAQLARTEVGVRTGELRGSITEDYKLEGDAGVGRVRATAPHAMVHHEGSRPHIIRPRTAKVLRFEVGGTIVFAQQVSHPGTRPNPYLRSALRAI